MKPELLSELKSFWKVSRQSAKFPESLENFNALNSSGFISFSLILLYTRKNFPDAQKLSGMQCLLTYWVFLPLAYGIYIAESH